MSDPKQGRQRQTPMRVRVRVDSGGIRYRGGDRAGGDHAGYSKIIDLYKWNVISDVRWRNYL